MARPGSSIGRVSTGRSSTTSAYAGRPISAERGPRRRTRWPLAPRELVRRLGGRFATELGIHLRSRGREELFQWFLAAVLFGAPISHAVASRAFHEMVAAGASTPGALLRAGWHRVVQILDRAGYVRYDEKTATKLLTLCQVLLDAYSGDVRAVAHAAAGAWGLEQRLMALSPGIGPVTVGIFLRELRGIWSKAEPPPCAMAIAAACDLGYVSARVRNPVSILGRLEQVWRRAGGKAGDFADFETSLVRHGIALRRAQPRAAAR